MRTLEGRVAVVTGGAAGVGRGIAEVLAQEGAAVAVVDIDLGAAKAAADSLTTAGRKAIAVHGDVSSRESMERMAEQVLARYGRLDILCANAGIYPIRSLESITADEWDRVMSINVRGVAHSMQACVPVMRRQGYGRIVITSSITGAIVGAPNLAHYAASKAALLGLMRSAALEFVREGITVNAVQPGNVRTAGIASFGQQFIEEMAKSIPIGRLAEPEDVGWAVRFLASEETAYITGQGIVVDGGQILPEGGIEAEEGVA